MRTIQRGFKQRIARTFFKDNVATDPDALTVSVLSESGTALITTAETTFSELNVLANKTATGTFFVEITPDADEAIGIWILYWRYTFGTGASAETIVAQEILQIIGEDSVPQLADNYLSLDAVTRLYPQLFDMVSADEIYRVGAQASRALDSQLDGRFTVPIRKRSDLGIYDQVIVDAATLLAIARILRPRYPEEAAEKEEAADKLIQGLNGGRFRLWEEITSPEVGFQAPRPSTANTGTKIELELAPHAIYAGLYHSLIVVQVDGAGDLWTEDADGATFKVSIDGGKTWETTLQDAKDVWMDPAGCLGLSFRFFRRGSSGNLAVGDKWEIEAWPLDTETTPSRGQIRRGKILL